MSLNEKKISQLGKVQEIIRRLNNKKTQEVQNKAQAKE
jgi:hypothetical protein